MVLAELVLTGASLPVRPPLPAPAGSGRVAGAVCGTSVPRPFKPYIPMNGTAVLFCSPAPQQRSHPYLSLFSSHCGSGRGLRIPSGPPMILAGQVLPGTSYPVRTASLHLRFRPATQDRDDPAFVTLRISILTTGTSCDRSSRGLRCPSGPPRFPSSPIEQGTDKSAA